MLNVTRIGLAAALVIGSLSIAAAQTVEGPADQAGPSVSRTTRGHTARHARAERHLQNDTAPSNSSSSEPWSSSLDAGNTSGGN